MAKKFASVFINSSSIRKNFDLIKKLNVDVVLSMNFSEFNIQSLNFSEKF